MLEIRERLSALLGREKKRPDPLSWKASYTETFSPEQLAQIRDLSPEELITVYPPGDFANNLNMIRELTQRRDFSKARVLVTKINKQDHLFRDWVDQAGTPNRDLLWNFPGSVDGE